MAKNLGTREDYETYQQRSRNWQNLWNPDARYGEFTGFICPRNSDGTWVEIDPGQHWASWVKHFYEATSYNYSFFVPHDVPALIEKCGGEDAFIRRLVHGIETGLVDYGNEPAFLASYLFAYTTKPWLITDSIDKLRDLFTMDGPPGNDDSGAMSSWYIFSSVGFFPNAGQNLYYLTSPRYDHTVIMLPGGKEITIRANNLTAENKYIQAVRINGQRWCSTMFTHELIRDGAVIEFDMGAEAVDYTK
ncbi:MAG: glycoside hydrolase family 92 protein [Clostridia bacterium]|nr:glycoside hydrolase family 92 protein [Clostridia bacterium]